MQGIGVQGICPKVPHRKRGRCFCLEDLGTFTKVSGDLGTRVKRELCRGLDLFRYELGTSCWGWSTNRDCPQLGIAVAHPQNNTLAGLRLWFDRLKASSRIKLQFC